MRDNYGDKISVSKTQSGPARVFIVFSYRDDDSPIAMSLSPFRARKLVRKINKAIKEIEHG